MELNDSDHVLGQQDTRLDGSDAGIWPPVVGPVRVTHG